MYQPILTHNNNCYTWFSQKGLTLTEVLSQSKESCFKFCQSSMQFVKISNDIIFLKPEEQRTFNKQSTLFNAAVFSFIYILYRMLLNWIFIFIKERIGFLQKYSFFSSFWYCSLCLTFTLSNILIKGASIANQTFFQNLLQ